MMRTRTILGIVLLAVLVSGCQGLFQMGGGGTVSGTVTVEGNPPGNLEVHATALGTRFSTPVDGDTGAFQIEGLPPGNYNIGTTGPGIGVTSVPVTVRRGANVTGIELDTVWLPPLPYTLTFENEDDARLVEPMNGSPFERAQDEDGNWVYSLSSTIITLPPGAAGNYRYALLKYSDIDEFVLEMQVGGASPHNPTFVFGWQDPSNYHYVFLTASAAVRVGHVKNGTDTQTNQWRPGVTDLWSFEPNEYRTVRIETVRQGDNVHIRTYLDGEFIEVLERVLPSEDYTPGRVGFGSYNGGQRIFFDDIYLEER